MPHNITFAEPLSAQKDYQDRDFQLKGVSQICDYLQEGFKRILAISPTGTGKTTISKMVALCDQIRQTIKCDHKPVMNILFIAHREFLLNQAHDTFKHHSTINLITQSAHSKISDETMQQGIDMVIIDEAHHEAMTSIQKQLETISDLTIIGLTANDFRGDNKLLKFERTVVFISKQDAMAQGYNSTPRIHTVLDYSKNDKAETTIKLIKEYHHHMNNTLIFMRTTDECQRLKDELSEAGFNIEVVDGNTTETELAKILHDLSHGELKFIANCEKIGEGMDGKNITDTINAKSYTTAGSGRKEQEIGRTLRPDSESRIWELVNPLKECALAKDLVGATLSQRLMWLENNEWHDELIEGCDDEWNTIRQLNPLSHSALEVHLEETKGTAMETPTDEALEVEQLSLFG